MKALFLANYLRIPDRLGIYYLSACAKKFGHEVLFKETFRKSYDELVDLIKKEEIGLVCYSCMTGEHHYIFSFNRGLKKKLPYIKTIMGGAHPTFYPETIEEDGIDITCTGEGERAFVSLLDALDEGKDYSRIPNLSVKVNGEIIRNEVGPLIEDLDEIPPPDRELVYREVPMLKRNIRLYAMASRGCPYSCTYCFNHQYNKIYRGKGSILRSFSAKRFVSDLEYIKHETEALHITIIDDTFPLKPKNWIETFAEEYSKKIGIPFGVFFRPGVIKQDELKTLTEAGLESAHVGLETANEQVAKDILSRCGISNKTVAETVEMLHTYKVKILFTVLNGLPIKNSLDVDLETLDFVIKMKPFFTYNHMLYPYKNTDIYQIAKNADMLADIDSIKTITQAHECSFKIPNREYTNRLVCLFPIIAEYPTLRGLLPVLIRLPLNSLYYLLFWIFNAYKNYMKLYQIPLKRKIRMIWDNLGPFFRFIFDSVSWRKGKN